MARPPRNTVDYFPFYCDDGKKMFYIEQTYGNDGFSTFIKLLRELAKTEYHYLNLSDNATVMFLSAKCRVSKEILLNIIKDLADLGKFDKQLWTENGIIWCQDFIDSIQDAYKKRNNKCITYEGLLTLLHGLGIRKLPKGSSEVPVKPQTILKNSKEEEIKEEEIKKTVLEKNFKEILSSDQFIEQLAMQISCTIEQAKAGIEKKLYEFAATGEIYRSDTENKRHLLNFARKNKEYFTGKNNKPVYDKETQDKIDELIKEGFMR